MHASFKLRWENLIELAYNILERDIKMEMIDLQQFCNNELHFQKGDNVVVFTLNGNITVKNIIDVKPICVDNKIMYLLKTSTKKVFIHEAIGIEIGTDVSEGLVVG